MSPASATPQTHLGIVVLLAVPLGIAALLVALAAVAAATLGAAIAAAWAFRRANEVVLASLGER
jgi:hypothetical protein